MKNPRASAALGNGRHGEGPFWKLVRLWPLVMGIAAVTGAIYVMSDNVGDLQAAQKVQWGKISDNEKSINALQTQTKVIEYRLDSVDKNLTEQKADIKEILREVKK